MCTGNNNAQKHNTHIRLTVRYYLTIVKINQRRLLQEAMKYNT